MLNIYENAKSNNFRISNIDGVMNLLYQHVLHGRGKKNSLAHKVSRKLNHYFNKHVKRVRETHAVENKLVYSLGMQC